MQSQNLNGDIDVFTAGTLRPLLKLTLYAEIASPVTKGIYLRKREDLILRVEARSPNDDEGTYRLTFRRLVSSLSPVDRKSPKTETPANEDRDAAGRREQGVSSQQAQGSMNPNRRGPKSQPHRRPNQHPNRHLKRNPQPHRRNVSRALKAYDRTPPRTTRAPQTCFTPTGPQAHATPPRSETPEPKPASESSPSPKLDHGW